MDLLFFDLVLLGNFLIEHFIGRVGSGIVVFSFGLILPMEICV